MKRSKKLILMTCVLAAVIVGTIAVNSLSGREREPEPDETINLALPRDTVASIGWEFDAEKLRLEKGADGEWFYSTDPAFPMDQGFPQAMLAALDSLTAVREFQVSGSAAEYGLENPHIIITITAADGVETVMNIGDKNEISGDYYLNIGSGNTVYMIGEPLALAFSQSFLDLVLPEVIKPMDTITGISIINGENVLEITTNEHDGEDEWFIAEDGGGDTGAILPLDPSEASGLRAAVTSLRWISCVSYNPTASELAEFGMDDPSYLTVSYITADEEEVVLTFVFGNADEFLAYVMLEGSNLVYQVDVTHVERILTS